MEKKVKLKNIVIATIISMMTLIEIIVNNANVIALLQTKKGAFFSNIAMAPLGVSRIFLSFYNINTFYWLGLTILIYILLLAKDSATSLEIKSKVNSINFVFKIIAAAVFAFYLIVDIVLHQVDYLGQVSYPLSLIITIILKFGALTYLTFLILDCFITLIERHHFKLSKIRTQKQNFSFTKSFLLILLLWLPYLIVLFPGTTTWDTTNQLIEFFNVGSLHSITDVYPIAHYLIPHNAIHLTDHHNLFVTLLYGECQKIGLTLFHSSSIGFFIVTLIQTLLLIYAMTYNLKVLWKYSRSTKLTRIFLLIYGLFPLFPIYAQYQVKNTLYCAFFLLYICLLIELYFNQNKLKSKKWQILFIIDAFGQLLTEKYAIYVLILSFGVSVLCYHKYWKRLSLILLLPILVFKIGISSIGYSAMHVVPGDPIESYGVMLQQTSLYLKKHPNDVSRSEYKTLNRVFNVSALKDISSPEYVDPLKSSGIYKHPPVYKFKTVTKRNLTDYKKVWLQMFIKHPVTYLEAGLNMGYMYLDFNAKQPMFFENTITDFLPLKNQKTKVLRTKYGKIEATTNKTFEPVRTTITYVMNFAEAFPFTSIFLNGNTLIWLVILMFLAIIQITQKLVAINVFFPLLIQMPIFLISPLDNSQRYMFPIIFTFIAYLIFLLLIKNKEAVTRNG